MEKSTDVTFMHEQPMANTRK